MAGHLLLSVRGFSTLPAPLRFVHNYAQRFLKRLLIALCLMEAKAHFYPSSCIFTLYLPLGIHLSQLD